MNSSDNSSSLTCRRSDARNKWTRVSHLLLSVLSALHRLLIGLRAHTNTIILFFHVREAASSCHTHATVKNGFYWQSELCGKAGDRLSQRTESVPGALSRSSTTPSLTSQSSYVVNLRVKVLKDFQMFLCRGFISQEAESLQPGRVGKQAGGGFPTPVSKDNDNKCRMQNLGQSPCVWFSLSTKELQHLHDVLELN